MWISNKRLVPQLNENATYQNPTHEANFKQGGAQIKHQGTEHKADAAGASIDGFGQRSGLPTQMEAQVQLMQVEEDVSGYPPDGTLGHFPKDGVSGFVKQRCARSRGAVW